ncbi:alpha/beta hydrolase [Bradyrhizobium sp. HKCCYLR1023]|uniref:alpha/beta hydrolase n=1 Tax=Bradyrhizobium TaxID=374 RepID=UPI003EBC7FB4
MEAKHFSPTENARSVSRYVLFATNRAIDQMEEYTARIRLGKILRYDRLFKPTLGTSTSFGWALVAYPAHHRPGSPDFKEDSSLQNPLKNFSIIDHQILATPEAFRLSIQVMSGSEGDRSLLFVPGIDTSFNDGAERLAQLVVDLDIQGSPVLFSWPSDNLRLIPTQSLLGLTPTSYLDTANIAAKSIPHLTRTIDEVAHDGVPFDVLAHSMGSEITVSSVSGRSSGLPVRVAEGQPDSIPAMPSLIFAAPDVSTKEFSTVFRKRLVERSKHITVYCSDDHALWMSANIRPSDERLGYCLSQKQPMDGVEFVPVVGGTHDFANHSYYILAREMLSDIKSVLSAEITTQSLPPGKERKIEIHSK